MATEPAFLGHGSLQIAQSKQPGKINQGEIPRCFAARVRVPRVASGNKLKKLMTGLPSRNAE